MLLRHGAEVDVLTEYGKTPLRFAIKQISEECAELLLDAGARISMLTDDEAFPEWWHNSTLSKRVHCRASCVALYGVLKKRWRLADGQRVPPDMIRLLTRLVWQSWRDERWQLGDAQPTPSKASKR